MVDSYNIVARDLIKAKDYRKGERKSACLLVDFELQSAARVHFAMFTNWLSFRSIRRGMMVSELRLTVTLAVKSFCVCGIL